MAQPFQPSVSTRARTVPLLSALARIWQSMLRSYGRSRERRALTYLSDDSLRDIGLTRADVEREIAKSFWRP